MSKTIYELRDEHYDEIEVIIYDQVSEIYDFHNGLENIIEEQLNNEEILFNILFNMEIVDELGEEIVEEEDENENN